MDYILSSFSSKDLSSDDGYTEGDDPTRRRRSTREERDEVRKQVVAELEAEIMLLTEQIENVKTELSCRKDIRQSLKVDHEAFVELSNERILNLQRSINKALVPGDVSRRSSLDSLYIGTMRNVAGPGSMYVQQIQGQVCRSLHMVAMHRKMRDLMNEQAQDFVSFMKMQADQQRSEAAHSTRAYNSRTFEVTCQMRACSESNEPIINFQLEIIRKQKEHQFQLSREKLSTSNTLSTSAQYKLLQRSPVRKTSFSSSTFPVNSSNEIMSNSEESSNDGLTFLNTRPGRRASLSSLESMIKGPSKHRPPLGNCQKPCNEIGSNNLVPRAGRERMQQRLSNGAKKRGVFSRSMSPSLTFASSYNQTV